MSTERRYIHNETEMLELGAELANNLFHKEEHPQKLFYLTGELGAGKTVLVRGFLRALGHEGRVKSPTYALVETYEIQEKIIHHFDFYRIAHAREIDTLGLEEYFLNDSICLIEWPEKLMGLLPKPDVLIRIELEEERRLVTILKGNNRT